MVLLRVKLTLAAFTAALGTGLVSCDGGSGAPAPTIILISLDTVRADNLSCYGGPEGATPNLDAFAALADRHETCISSAPWTMPTHASLFTGLYPFEHGAHSFMPDRGHRGDNVYALHARIETLAEALGSRGYLSAGIVANSIYLRPGLGLEQGFETWQVRRDPGDRVTARALKWLGDTQEAGKPRFLFINYLDAHRPYATGDREDRPRARLDELIDRVMVEGKAPGSLGPLVRGLHQKAVTHLDAEIGRLLHDLRQMGVLEDALVVITSDHGEAFGEHGVVEHSKDLYEELVRVPLIVKAPGQLAGAVHTEAASSVDIPGLVAALLPGSLGADLRERFPRVPGAHQVVAENSFSRIRDLERFGTRFHRTRRAVYDGPMKLILDSTGGHELYDLANDPGETSNLAEARPELVQGLLEKDRKFVGDRHFEGARAFPTGLTSIQVKEMGALGYGGAGDDDDREGTPR